MERWQSIRASAGSGKTFALTLRYISLLFFGARANEILCITFTNKARDEMLARITNTLFLLCQNPNDAYSQNLLDLGISKSAIETQSGAIYRHFVESKNHIMTFDAFFNAVVKKFSFYAGVRSDYEVGADFKLDGEIFKKTLDLLGGGEFDALIEFCAKYQLNQKDILSMINSLKNGEFLGEIAESSDLKDEIINAFDELRAFAINAVDGQKNAHFIKSRFNKNIDKKNVSAIVENIFKLTEGMQKTLDSAVDSAIIARKTQNLKDLCKKFFEMQESEILWKISNIYAKFKKQKLQVISSHNKLTFSDISEICYDLLHNHIDKNFFYFRLDSKINHILVDEFQDTNLEQYENLKPLIDEIKSGDGARENKTLFFVGDEKQAIYGFRGGESRLFRAISDELNMSEKTLKDNYRSAKNIVEFVNSAFQTRFPNYEMQNPKSKNDGFVEIVSESEADSAFDLIERRIQTLLANHKKNIAILTRNVSSAEEIYGFLRAHFPHTKIALESEKSNNVELLIIQNALRFLQTNNIFYLKNCVKLNGGEVDSAPSLAIKKDAEVHKIIHRIMQTFALRGIVALRILEESAKFDDLEKFIAYLGGAEIKNAADLACEIQIMTIHKSKGLEFEDVIICDLKGQNNRDTAQFYAPSLRGGKVYFLGDKKARVLVDDEFANIVAQKKSVDENDALNVLYVAFTRAKDSLFIIKSAKKNALRLELLDLKDGKIGSDIIGEKSPKFAESSAKIPAQYDFGKQGDFIKQSEKSYTNLSKMRGIALHLALEMRLAYGNSDDEIETILQNRFGMVLGANERAQILRSVGKILGNAALREILANAESVRCEVAYLENNRLNRIDCLIEMGGDAVILDYKSSDLDLEGKKAQILRYADFARAHYKNIRAYLCFANGEILEV
ncbi:RecB-like helicase [Helicobacter sp. 23-1044]